MTKRQEGEVKKTKHHVDGEQVQETRHHVDGEQVQETRHHVDAWQQGHTLTLGSRGTS
jgi:hypothetical protein